MKHAHSDAAIYHGDVVHKRFTPLRHRLSYRVFSLLLPLHGIGDVCGSTRFLSHNRFNLVAFHDCDHGRRDGSSVSEFVTQTMRAGGVDTDACDLFVLCYPRVLGYCFNPLTTYYAISADGTIDAMLYEVSGYRCGRITRPFSMRTSVVAEPRSQRAACCRQWHVSR